MSDWEQFFEAEVIRILGLEEFDTREEHHFALRGRPFVSAYQLAVAFERDNRELCQRLGKKMGDGEGMENLPTYIARQLSQKFLEDQANYPVEPIWLSGTGLPVLLYRHDGQEKRGTPNRKYNGYSLFRLRQTNPQ